MTKDRREKMTEKRFEMKKLEYESYFIDSQQEYVDEDEPNFKINGEKTMSDSQILDLLNENEQLKKEKEFWKSDACSLSSLNSILSNELSIAQEQGYEPSIPYKEYITSRQIERLIK